MKSQNHNHQHWIPEQIVQSQLTLEEPAQLERLPEANREQCMRLLVDLLLAVEEKLPKQGGFDEY
jgi:hypothetical protein